MAVDPYVSSKLEDKPRQEQNLAPGVHLPAARSWRANRPGELGPGQPEGSLLGSPGPNVGYALTLANRVVDKWQLAAHERKDDAVAVVAELAMRRASVFGRAPVATDVAFASQILGYDTAPSLSEWREHVVHHAAHDYPTRRSVVDAVPDSVLKLAPAELTKRLATIRESLSSAFTTH